MLSEENSSSDMAERDWVIIKALMVKEILSAELTFKLQSTWKFSGVRKWGEEAFGAKGDSPDKVHSR